MTSTIQADTIEGVTVHPTKGTGRAVQTTTWIPGTGAKGEAALQRGAMVNIPPLTIATALLAALLTVPLVALLTVLLTVHPGARLIATDPLTGLGTTPPTDVGTTPQIPTGIPRHTGKPVATRSLM
ncbi:hypothetical protein FQA47_020852 [Oryzias melastigma]|uniref:Uncharacterized protein n=1 Tax=Oryzias melastigma TaxID=30732 RepID=A0A834CM15_ORYME|nr:hypothetical protein FQA47_020852 [Oryzias melastigma]